ncbi:butyrate kinase [bacterium]|nr:butyrate kinase [bacterium]
MSERILVLNPGTTSTKVAVFDGTDCLWQESIGHDAATLHSFGTVAGQLDHRYELIDKDIPEDARGWTAVVGRGGLLRPLEGGIYAVNDSMLQDARKAQFGEHASNLGSMLANRFAAAAGVPAYVVDPVTTDEFGPIPRISGVPGIERKCRAHALNIKAVARRTAKDMGVPFDESRFVVAHLGGGISIAALAGGRIQDVNDGLLGMGPFSPERSGALPLQGVIDLVRDKGYDEAKRIFSKDSGFVGYFGTADLRDIEAKIAAGDELAELVFEAMVYQIAKEIGAMAAALSGNLNGVVLTGGLVHSGKLRRTLEDYVNWIPGGVHLQPGEEEMLALAEGGLRALRGEEKVLVY